MAEPAREIQGSPTTAWARGMVEHWRRVGVYLLNAPETSRIATVTCHVPWLADNEYQEQVRLIKRALRPGIEVINPRPIIPATPIFRSWPRAVPPKFGRRRFLRPAPQASDSPDVVLHRVKDKWLLTYRGETQTYRRYREALAEGTNLAFERKCVLRQMKGVDPGRQHVIGHKTIRISPNPPPARFESNWIDGLGWVTIREAEVMADYDRSLSRGESIECTVDARFDATAVYAEWDSWITPGYRRTGREILPKRDADYDEEAPRYRFTRRRRKLLASSWD